MGKMHHEKHLCQQADKQRKAQADLCRRVQLHQRRQLSPHCCRERQQVFQGRDIQGHRPAVAKIFKDDYHAAGRLQVRRDSRKHEHIGRMCKKHHVHGKRPTEEIAKIKRHENFQ